MSVIVENGSIVANANSYVSEATLTAFAAARGLTLTSDATQLLIKSMDYIESLQYIGSKLTRNQALEWPRMWVWIDGYPVDPTTIPQQLKDGQCQTAIAIDQGNDPLQDTPRATRREKVGEIEVEYATSAATVTTNKKILNTLWKLLGASGNSGNIIKVGKA